MQVTNEFNLIMHMEDARDAFDNEWELWEPAIIEYTCAMHRKPDAFQSALQDKNCDIGMLLLFQWSIISEI